MKSWIHCIQKVTLSSRRYNIGWRYCFQLGYAEEAADAVHLWLWVLLRNKDFPFWFLCFAWGSPSQPSPACAVAVQPPGAECWDQGTSSLGTSYSEQLHLCLWKVACDFPFCLRHKCLSHVLLPLPPLTAGYFLQHGDYKNKNWNSFIYFTSHQVSNSCIYKAVLTLW